MKLSQLYANKDFKNIVFNDGLNLILAKVTKKLDLNKDSHNLGKTTLIFVIDFMLLKSLTEDHIFKKYQEKFTGYTFYLEILLNNGQYLTIKRSVDASSKISFKHTKVSTILLEEKEWDDSNLSFAAAEEKLNQYLSFNVLEEWGYRKSVTYFLRSQQDYSDLFQLSKFKGKDVYWKPFMFDLLGFNGNLLEEKYKTDAEIVEQKSFISGLKTKFAVDADEVDKIIGAISLKEAEKIELEQQIDNFNFYQQERKLNKELVEDVERHISELNSIEYNLEFDLEKAKESFSKNIAFDVAQLKQIYEEAQIFFSDNLVKDYKALEDFNKRITEERNKYLEEKIIELTEQLKIIRGDLLSYDNKRNQILSVLKDKDSFRKFKGYQIDLTKIEGELSRLDEKLKSIDRISLLNEATNKLTQNLEVLVKKINTEITANEDNKIYPEIRRVFHNVFKYIVNAPAIIFMSQNSKGNIEFKVEVTKENEVDITAEGKGNTYQKLLCISFDIAVLVAYHKQSFYHFVYHDGALEGLDNRKKANYINLMKEYCKRYNLQYIFTSIEHDIPQELLKSFSSKEICLTLNDSGDDGKLFGFSF